MGDPRTAIFSCCIVMLSFQGDFKSPLRNFWSGEHLLWLSLVFFAFEYAHLKL